MHADDFVFDQTDAGIMLQCAASRLPNASMLDLEFAQCPIRPGRATTTKIISAM